MVGLIESESFGHLIEEPTPLPGIRHPWEARMLLMKKPRPAIRSVQGWAISVLLETGAIRECEEHGWMRDRADPHARERAFILAHEDPPAGLTSQEAIALIEEVLSGIGDACPDCLPNG